MCTDPECEATKMLPEVMRLLQEFKNREQVFHADIEWLLRNWNAASQAPEKHTPK